MPLGLGFVLLGGMDEARARAGAARLLAAFGLATLGYWATGFALQYGGIGCLHDLPGLEALAQQFPLWNLGGSWGLAGTAGWGLAVPSASLEGVLGLYLGQLPWVLALGALAGLSLLGRERGTAGWLAVLLAAAVLGPLVAGWAWAGGPSAAQPFLCARPDDPLAFDLNYGGWLGNLGLNAGWGHGFVDFAGSGTLHLLAGALALAAAVTFGPRRPRPQPGEVVTMPPVHLPLLAALGLGLWLAGWLAWPLAHPLYAGLPWNVIALNGLVALGAGTLAAQLYAAFTTGRADVLMAVRGGAAGLVAISAGAPFVPFWGALVIGLLAGALVPLVHYLVEQVWAREDLTATLAVHAAGGLWGLVALGLLASGQYGVGWNAWGAESYLGASPPQGVGGLIAAPGLLSDMNQILAQLAGAAIIALAGFVPALAVFQLAHLPAVLAARRTRRARRERSPAQESLQAPLTAAREPAPGLEPGSQPASEPAREQR
jgi:Amt family ammonium transporter